jgi:hypothetical protein
MPPEEEEVELTENEIKVTKIGLDLMTGLLFTFAKDPATAGEAHKMIEEFEKTCDIGPDDLGLVATALAASDKLTGIIGGLADAESIWEEKVPLAEEE